MIFGSPEFLNLLWLLLPLFFFLHWAWKKRLEALKRFGNILLVERLMEGVSREKQKAKLVLVFFVFGFSLMVLAHPLWGRKEQQIISRGHDIILALDVSKSMLAEDIKPNRLSKAKHEISSMISRMQGNRIGLVIFAGEAFVQCPLTLDYAAAKLLLSEVEVGSIPVPGTAIAKAIEKCLDSFPPGERESRAIILITDGEDTTGDSQKAAKRSSDEGVLIYSIGIGDPLGVPIPVKDDSGKLSEYVKDKGGNVVSSKLNEDSLRNICLTTGGAYYGARADEFELGEIVNHMAERRQQQLLESRFISHHEERFQYFLLPALVLLMVEMLLSDRKRAPKRTVGGF